MRKKHIYILLFFMLSSLSLIGQPSPDNATAKDIKVYVFMLDECLICQHYSIVLNDLHAEFASNEIEFVGLFPNFVSNPKQIAHFKKKYQIPFELKTDYYKTKANQFNAQVTPEVVVYDALNDIVLYQGRIDNAYFQLGKKRRIITQHELRDALSSLQNGEEIAVKKTEAVGCLINFKEN